MTQCSKCGIWIDEQCQVSAMEKDHEGYRVGDQKPTQPLLIMMAIPFGVVGAIVGHLVMGYNLSMLSMFGLVALSGVVINGNRRSGQAIRDAVISAGVRRFRPILLTSLTTFFGLMPMILETSVQAYLVKRILQSPLLH
ncbi:MAG: efflux RND transporter permease subunit [Desulfobacterium sp.]|nr:efflux RND transporter permease subunit [Desulfobacterium sp.]